MNETKSILIKREEELFVLKEKEHQLENRIDELVERRDRLESHLQDESISLEERDALTIEISTLNERLDDLEKELQDVILIEIESLEEEIQNLKKRIK